MTPEPGALRVEGAVPCGTDGGRLAGGTSAERRAEVASVLLGLLQEGSKGLSHIRQSELRRLLDPLTVAIQLAFLELEV